APTCRGYVGDLSGIREGRRDEFRKILMANKSSLPKLKDKLQRREYLEVLRKMTGEQRMRLGFELHDLSIRLMQDGIRDRHPEYDERQIQQEAARRLLRCTRKSSLLR
ncbi:MAG: hypothetical protein QME74_08475, partial [Candidatus Edwardsbacteria bacterium]|nr:hypothetical protein [Candidatus Edwardsbacteria bacterium]